ncbi:MAG: Na/Pi symporter [Verrucomicrobia bacterium]|nr:Na/Pi symporter [Verrucomicrobiota bacterium]
MNGFSGAILGLGLFFLGLQLTGQNMRALAGGGFRTLAGRATGNPFSAGLCGIVAGALMQSATAVTFILVSMLGSGIVRSEGARMVLVWCNVGLTALAFIAAFSIHPFVALLVGFAGIAMGAVRKRPWNAIAGAVLGVGIILFGLEQLGEGLAPLKNEGWFRSGLEFAMASPLQGFLTGIAAAAILQSNTGATMVLITLVGSGGLSFPQAVPAIYGANLGAIALRAFLSRGMSGAALRLVRMEDLFCVFSGVVMMALLEIERTGVPLVQALVEHFVAGEAMRLATVFLLSNLIPAVLITPALPLCSSLLKRIWPTDPAEQPGRPRFLVPQALADPETALDLVRRELGRFFGMISISRSPEKSEDEDTNEPQALVQLGTAIEQFCARLAAEAELRHSQALRLQRLRAWLHTLRHISEAAGELSASLGGVTAGSAQSAEPLLGWVRDNVRCGAEATSTLSPEKIHDFHERSKTKTEEVRKMRADYEAVCLKAVGREAMKMSVVLDNFDILAWLIHRLSKLQMRAVVLPTGSRSSAVS